MFSDDVNVSPVGSSVPLYLSRGSRVIQLNSSSNFLVSYKILSLSCPDLISVDKLLVSVICVQF